MNCKTYTFRKSMRCNYEKSNRSKTCNTKKHTNEFWMQTRNCLAFWLRYVNSVIYYECIGNWYRYCLLHSALRPLRATIFIFLHKFKLKYGVCFVNKYYSGRHSLSKLNDMMVSVMAVSENTIFAKIYSHQEQITKRFYLHCVYDFSFIAYSKCTRGEWCDSGVYHTYSTTYVQYKLHTAHCTMCAMHICILHTLSCVYQPGIAELRGNRMNKMNELHSKQRGNSVMVVSGKWWAYALNTIQIMFGAINQNW